MPRLRCPLPQNVWGKLGGGRRFGRGETFDLKSDVLKKGGKMDIWERHSVALVVRLLQCAEAVVSPPKEEMKHGWLAVWRFTQTNKQTHNDREVIEWRAAVLGQTELTPRKCCAVHALCISWLSMYLYVSPDCLRFPRPFKSLQSAYPIHVKHN